MNSNTDVVINRSVRLVQTTGKLQITKAYAESKLSPSALKYAEKSDTHYLWDWGRSAYVVVFELPRLFNLTFPEVLRYMINFCMPYMVDNNLTDSVFYNKYMENHGKDV